MAVDCSLDDPASFGGRSRARIRSSCKCGDEGLSHGGVAVARYERPLVKIGVVASHDILAWPAGQRNGRLAIPELAPGEGHVERDLASAEPDQQISVDVDQTVLRDGCCDLVTVALADLLARSTVHAVHDLRLRIWEAFGEHLGKE